MPKPLWALDEDNVRIFGMLAWAQKAVPRPPRRPERA